MKHLRKFNESNDIDKIIYEIDNIINYDEDGYDPGDEPSRIDILSELGDLTLKLNITADQLKQVINSRRVSDPDGFINIILDEILEEEMKKNKSKVSEDDTISLIEDIIQSEVELRNVQYSDDIEKDPDSVRRAAIEIFKMLKNNKLVK